MTIYPHTTIILPVDIYTSKNLKPWALKCMGSPLGSSWITLSPGSNRKSNAKSYRPQNVVKAKNHTLSYEDKYANLLKMLDEEKLSGDTTKRIPPKTRLLTPDEKHRRQEVG